MKVKFYVMYIEWDNAYKCFVDKKLREYARHETAEKFCLDYKGELDQLFIMRVFKKSGGKS